MIPLGSEYPKYWEEYGKQWRKMQRWEPVEVLRNGCWQYPSDEDYGLDDE
jgi:hypothetical protein